MRSTSMRYKITRPNGETFQGIVEELHEQGLHGTDCVFVDREWAAKGHPATWSRGGWTVELSSEDR